MLKGEQMRDWEDELNPSDSILREMKTQVLLLLRKRRWRRRELKKWWQNGIQSEGRRSEELHHEVEQNWPNSNSVGGLDNLQENGSAQQNTPMSRQAREIDCARQVGLRL